MANKRKYFLDVLTDKEFSEYQKLIGEYPPHIDPEGCEKATQEFKVKHGLDKMDLI